MKPTALITGGQRGIGLGIARALAPSHKLMLVAEVPPEDPAVTGALEELGPDALYMQHDLRRTDRITDLLDRVGSVQTLVSNAGIAAPVRGDMLDVGEDAFDTVLDINLRGAFFLAQRTAQRMLAGNDTGYRSMIFVTSVSAEMASVERAEYCISKAGASMMTRLFAARLAAEGIGVFELRPGIIETDMTAAVRDSYTTRIEDGLVPARRWGVPEDMGEVVRALVDGRMAFSTGAVIPVDGGLSIPRL